jgi:hypothetical protein
LDLQVLVIAKIDRVQVFVMQEFVLLVRALQPVQVLQALQVLRVLQPVQVLRVLQPVQMSLVQKLPLVWVVFHHEVLLQLVHSLLKNYLLYSKNYLQGYKF